MVRPFCGVHFGKIKPFGVSILVLGESSYNGMRGERLHYAWNKWIIQCVFERQRDTTITRAAGVFFGEWRSFPQRSNFWRTSAFANFVQTDMGKPGQRPIDRHWQGGRRPFFEYLKCLHPQFVLALGKDLWEQLPRQHRVKCSPIRVGTETRPCFLYPNGNSYSMVFGIDHPARRNGWSYDKWTPWVQAAVLAARKFHLRHRSQ
jgi:hypothetical protein